MSRLRSGTIARVGACSLAALGLLAGPALAAKAPKGGVYRGALSGGQAKISIGVRVSPAGTEVVGVTLSALPIYCPGNGPPGTPSIVFAKAKISAAGKFSAIGKDMILSGPLKGSVAATLSVSGTFTPAGALRGTLATSYGGGAKSCGGHSSYSART
jgi:hypothetical protein